MSIRSLGWLMPLGAVVVLCVVIAWAMRGSATGDTTVFQVDLPQAPETGRPQATTTAAPVRPPPAPAEPVLLSPEQLAALPPIERHARLLGLEPGSSLVVVNEETDHVMHHYRYEQAYLGVRIHDRNFVVNEYFDGRSPWTTGVAVQGLAKAIPSVTPRLSTAQAMAVAERAVSDATGRTSLVRHDIGRYILAAGDAPRLVYIAVFTGYLSGKEDLIDPMVVIDANTGEIVARRSTAVE